MRALIFALATDDKKFLLNEDRPLPLLGIVDKPIIARIIERLAAKNVNKFDILIHNFPEKIHQALECCQCGLDIQCHFVKDARYPFSALRKNIPRWDEEDLIIGQGDFLPIDSLDELLESESTDLAIYNTQNEWLGWAKIQKQHFSRITASATLEGIEAIVSRSSEKKYSSYQLSARSFSALLEANNYAMSSESSGLTFPTGIIEREHGIWLSPTAVIGKDVKLQAPVFIGNNCIVKEGASIGPHTVIESGSIIDRNSSIIGSVVSSGSYVGEELNIVDSLVDRSKVAISKNMELEDAFNINEFKEGSAVNWTTTFLEKFIAFAGLLILSPCLLALCLFRRITYKDFVQLPAGDQEQLKKGALMQLDGGKFKSILVLWNILKGEYHFVGLTSRSCEEVKKLPQDWQRMYLKSKAGLLTLADNYEPKPQESLFAKEAYYCAHQSLIFDIKILFKYLKKRLRRA